MSNARKEQRRIEIRDVFEEGRQAGLLGKSIQTNPYHGTIDFAHWSNGWEDGVHEVNKMLDEQ